MFRDAVMRMSGGAALGAVAALGYAVVMNGLGSACNFACDPLVSVPLGAGLGAVARLFLRDDEF